MSPPSNWDEEISLLRDRIREKLNEASKKIVEEEILKILGRVKIFTIFTSVDLRENQYSWFIESVSRQEPLNDDHTKSK
jgi:hypothetical protein